MELSLEQLINIRVTSVSKKETVLSESAAAVSVITQEDIRRLGLTSIPEALRMVPGMNVARINAGQWAVSSRGFNGQFANKLLVLVDGRAVYTPSFAGVYWDVQDVVMEDLDRIEVIRGPGATLWGANAVNGVINIITKSAKETQGLLVSGIYGTEDQPTTSIRYGGQLAENLHYRAYVKYFDREGFVNAMGDEMPDDRNMLRGGLRLDWEPSEGTTFTLQGDYYDGESGANRQRASLTPPFAINYNTTANNSGGNVLGRWTRSFSEISQLTVQAYYDQFEQNAGFGLNPETRDTFDLDMQHRFAWGDRHDIVWGTGYRYTSDKLPGSFGLTWTPESRDDQLFSAFLQDEITLVHDRLRLTLGSKLEHNDYTGFEIQPSGRLLWTPTEKQTVWTSVSRAVRTPSRFDRGSRLNAAAFQPSPFAPPFLVSLFGNPEADSEKVMAYELGYRIEPTERLSFDIAGFYNLYDDLLTFVPGPSRFEANPSPPHVLVSPLTFQNSLSGETYGVELSTQWKVTEHWNLTAGYTHLHMRLRPDQSSEGDSPQYQLHLRSYLNIRHNLELNGALYYVDRLPNQQIPSYLRFDLGLVWRPTKSLEIGIWGQNLLDNQHPEFTTDVTPVRTEIPRSVLGKITWRF